MRVCGRKREGGMIQIEKWEGTIGRKYILGGDEEEKEEEKGGGE